MNIKQGSGDVPLFIKPRVDGVVITISAWEALYGGGAGAYRLLLETADKSGTEDLLGVADANGVLFILPASMFTIAQRDWTAVMKFVINSITDFSLYNFDIKVTKPESVNSR